MNDLQPSIRIASAPGPEPAIEIVLNGAATTIAAALPVDRLVAGIIAGESRGVAVAVNDAVVPRAAWSSHRLKSGDAVEIVRAVRGG
jgi:sulfur carrier protein